MPSKLTALALASALFACAPSTITDDGEVTPLSRAEVAELVAAIDAGEIDQADLPAEHRLQIDRYRTEVLAGLRFEAPAAEDDDGVWAAAKAASITVCTGTWTCQMGGRSTGISGSWSQFGWINDPTQSIKFCEGGGGTSSFSYGKCTTTTTTTESI
jgi:hypothetical protein